jgi:hypothetical protein
MGRKRDYDYCFDYRYHPNLDQEIEPLGPNGKHVVIVIWSCIVLKIDLTSQTSPNQDQVNQVVNSSGNQQLRLYVLFLPILPLLPNPFSALSALSHLRNSGLTLFRLNHHNAATPSMIKAATTGPAMTPGLIDFPPELAGFGIHSICAQDVHDL